MLTQFIRVGPTSPTVFSDPLSRSRQLRRSDAKQIDEGENLRNNVDIKCINPPSSS